MWNCFDINLSGGFLSMEVRTKYILYPEEIYTYEASLYKAISTNARGLP